MYRKLTTLALISVLSSLSFAQTLENESAGDAESKLKKEAVAFLRDTMADVSNLRTLENRISFNAELASLLWQHDERDAAALFASVISDFKSLVFRYDSMANSVGLPGEDENLWELSFFDDTKNSATVSRKLTVAMAVRQQITMSIARNEPEVALRFFRESAEVITNQRFRKDLDRQDPEFERLLLVRIGETNAANGLRMGRASLEKGLKREHIELLKAIYKKDTEKGIEFGSAIRVRLEKEKASMELYWLVESLLGFGSETLENSGGKGGKKPVYSSDDLRSIAETYLAAVLELNNNDLFNLEEDSLIAKFAPVRTAQVRARYARPKRSDDESDDSDDDIFASKKLSNAQDTISNSAMNRKQMREEWQETEKKTLEDIAKIGTGELAKEEHERIIKMARGKLMRAPNLTAKLTGLSALAAQVRKSGDEKLAAEIISDVAALVNPQPRNFLDYTNTLLLIAGYAEADPEKAFPLLEDTIFRANGTLDAFIKVAEFIDIGDEIIVDGELQLGAFGGQQIRSVSGTAESATSTVRALALFDFSKTKALPNHFERPEIRVYAKMMILQALFDDKGSPEAKTVSVSQDN